MNDQPCTRKDLRVEVTATVCVTGSGDPIIEVQNYELVERKPYFCVGTCERDFDTWQEALDHLSNQLTPSLEAQKEVL